MLFCANNIRWFSELVLGLHSCTREASLFATLKRDAEIGAILGCAPRTISKHVENLCAKLGVTNRIAAAHRAQDGTPAAERSARDAELSGLPRP